MVSSADFCMFYVSYIYIPLSYICSHRNVCMFINIMQIIYCMCASSLSHVPLFATPWTVAHQASLFMGFSRQEYWSRLPCPPPGDLPNPEVEHRSPALQRDHLSHHGRPYSIYKISVIGYMLYAFLYIYIYINMKLDIYFIYFIYCMIT